MLFFKNRFPPIFVGHLKFLHKAKILYRQVFIAVGILCKFGEDIFINECDKGLCKNLLNGHTCMHGSFSSSNPGLQLIEDKDVK